MDLNELASDLFGSKRAESSTQPSTVSVMYGIATSDSADGLVSVWLSDNALSPTDAQAQWETVDSYDADAYEGMDESTSIEIPTEVTCFKDDVVRVQLTGAGAAKNPTVVGVVGRGDEQNQRLGSIEADYVKATELEADVAQIGFLKADNAVITSLQADTAKVHDLTADQLTAATAFIADLDAASITAQTLSADVAKVHNLTADQLSAAAAYIADLKADSIEATNISAMYGDFDTVKANAAKVASLDAQQLTAAVGYINTLTSASVTAQNLAADHATIGNLDANYARVDLVNANVAWLQNGLIKDASISDAKIIGVSANKLTAGTIDAAEINVMNLRADNLKVSRVNGQPVIGGYSLVDPSGSGYASKNPKTQGWYELTANGYVLTDDTTVVSGKAYYTTSTSVELYDQDYIDGLAEDLSDRIDGAIETFTSSAVPTPNNYPASDWTTDDIRATHVGDVCYVLNEDSDSDGWCYRYAYDNTTHQYGWVLIKDSDVTKALYELTDPNGELKTFETQTSTWKTATDNEITSIKSSQTSLETRTGNLETNKVDVSTFNSVSQKVDENSSTISTLSQTVSQKADSSTVTTLSNTVNTVKQTADTNKTSITNLTQTVTDNKTAIETRASTIEQNLSGITTRVSATESTLTAVTSGHPNCWRIDRYTRNARVNANSVVPVPSDFLEANFIETLYRAEADMGTNLNVGDLYLGKFTTYVHATANTSITCDFLHDDSAAFYLNDEFIKSATNTTTVSVTFTLVAGWNKLRFLLNEQSGADYARFSTRISTWANVDKQVADLDEYEGTIQESRLTSAETSITQNAEAIELRATKTEAYQVAQPNLSAYYSSVPYASTNTYWKGITTASPYVFTDMGDGWMRVQCANSGSSVVRRDWYPIPCPSIEPGKPYTWLAEIRNNQSDSVSSGSDFYLVQTNNCQFWGQQAIKTLNDPQNGVSEGAAISINLGVLGASGVMRKVQNAETGAHWTSGDAANVIGLACWTFRCAANSSIDYEVRLSVYEGEYTGPYKPYSGNQLYASQAELKVTNSEVSSKVSTTDYNGSTIASLINQSADSVVIEANHIQLNGSTVFNSIKSTLDSNYDAIGSASTVQTNLDNLQVGGRNLLLWTGEGEVYSNHQGTARLWNYTTIYGSVVVNGNTAVFTKNDSGLTNNTSGLRVMSLTSSGESANGSPGNSTQYNIDFAIGEQYTFSCDAKTSGNRVGLAFQYYNGSTVWASPAIGENTPSDTNWHRYTYTFTIPTDFVCVTALGIYCQLANGITLEVKNVKLESGNRATDWTPAPEDQVESAYATCSTAAGTAAKVVDASGMFDLHNGVTITVKFTTANTADAPTLNVNDTGAYPVWNNNAVAASGNPVKWGANATLSFIFDGSHWVLAEKAPSYSIACTTSATTRAKAATINGALVVNGTTVAVLFSTANTYVANSVQFNLSSTGAVNIYLDRAATSATHTFTWSANTVITLVRYGAYWYVSDGRAKEAVSVSQRIYYRSTSSTKPDAPTAWVEEATENVYNAWTTKVPPLAASTAEGQTKYLYLWTCEQRKAMSGSFVGCTDVQLDENTTVIDGGNIITHSITAESIQANSLTLGQISTTTQADILNANVVVGGRNLLRKTGSLSTSDLNLARATVTEDGIIALTPTTSAAYASFKVHYLDFDEYGSGTYTVSFDAKLSDATTTYTTSNVLAYLGFQDPTRVDSAVMNNTYDRYTPSRTLSSEITSEWQRFETLVNVPDDLTSGTAAALSSGYMMVVELGASAKKMPILVRRVKLEKGTKATDWTPAPEDQDSLITSSFGSLSDSFDGLDEIVNGEDGLQSFRAESSKRIGDLETYAEQLKKMLPALQETISWLSFTPNTGLVIGDAPDVETGELFYTQQTGKEMSFIHREGSGATDDKLMTLSATNGIEGPKVTSPLLVLGDYSIEESNGLFMINYIGS